MPVPTTRSSFTSAVGGAPAGIVTSGLSGTCAIVRASEDEGWSRNSSMRDERRPSAKRYRDVHPSARRGRSGARVVEPDAIRAGSRGPRGVEAGQGGLGFARIRPLDAVLEVGCESGMPAFARPAGRPRHGRGRRAPAVKRIASPRGQQAVALLQQQMSAGARTRTASAKMSGGVAR